MIILLPNSFQANRRIVSSARHVNASLSIPAIFSIRLYELILTSPSNPSNSMKGVTP
jgi:hypothetical protein